MGHAIAEIVNCWLLTEEVWVWATRYSEWDLW